MIDMDFDFICHARLEKLQNYLNFNKQENNVDIIEHNGFVEISLRGGIGEEITYDSVKLACDKAKQLGKKKVLLNIESVGGSALESMAIDEYLSSLEADDGFEFTVFTNKLNASGAYLLSCGRKEIYTSPVAQIGSIGAISIVCSQKKMYEKMGVEWSVFKSGEMKAFPNTIEELTSEQKEYMQKKVNELGENFISTVAEKRKIEKSKIRDLKARVLSSKEALQEKLIDGIKTKDQVISLMSNKSLENLLLIENVNEKSQIEIINMEEKDKKIESLESELREAKLSLIDKFSKDYQLASGNVCPENKLKALENLSIQEIKAEIEFCQPLIKSRYEKKAMFETTVKDGSMQMDSKQREDMNEALSIFNIVSSYAKAKKPNFNKETALKELQAKIGGLI